MQVVQDHQVSAERLYAHLEESTVLGMRKLAGFVMINKILAQNDGVIFYDALHALCGALRQQDRIY